MSASVTQLLSSCTSAAGVIGRDAFWGRRLPAGREVAGLSSRAFDGLAGPWSLSCLRAGLGIATDILRHEPLAVHSAQTDRSNARRSARLHDPCGRRRARVA